jgi:hypothetical protein
VASRHVLPKRRPIFNRLHGVIFQKIERLQNHRCENLRSYTGRKLSSLLLSVGLEYRRTGYRFSLASAICASRIKADRT